MQLYYLLIIIIVFSGYSFSQSALPDSSGNALIELEYDNYNLYKEKNNSSELDIGCRHLRISYSGKLWENRIKLSFSKAEYNLLSNNYESGLNISATSDIYEFSAQYEHTFKRISILADLNFIRTEHNLFPEYKIGFSLNNSLWYIRSASFSVLQMYKPFHFFADYYNSNLNIEHMNKSTGVTAEYTIQPAKFFSFNIGYALMFPEKASPDGSYSMNNMLNLNKWNSGIAFSDKTFSLSANYQLIRAYSAIDMYNTSLPFSYLYIDGLRYERLSIEARHNIGMSGLLAYKFCNYYLKVSVAGDLESWPFVDIFKAIIVNRLYLNCNAKISAQTFQLNGQFQSGIFTLRPEITYIHIQPELSAITWQPLFLAFGRRNISHSELKLKNADIGGIGLETVMDIGNIQLIFFASQYFPIHISRTNVSQTGPSGTDAGTPGQADGRTKTDGGRIIRFKMIYNL